MLLNGVMGCVNSKEKQDSVQAFRFVTNCFTSRYGLVSEANRLVF